jgi:hypothetical protein
MIDSVGGSTLETTRPKPPHVNRRVGYPIQLCTWRPVHSPIIPNDKISHDSDLTACDGPLTISIRASRREGVCFGSPSSFSLGPPETHYTERANEHSPSQA